MSLDPLSPIAPARVRALLLPLGQIKAARFSTFVERLQEEHVVHLRDITPDGRPNRNMFSPLAFPAGAILYELITHAPPSSHLALSPFELFREPLVIIALADGKELGRDVIGKRNSLNGRAPTLVEQNVRSLSQELEDLRDNYGKALVHQVLIFDYENPEGHEIPMPEGIIPVPPVEKSKRTTMKGVLCDVSRLLLAEMTTLAKSIQGTTFIDSPGQLSSSKLDGSAWAPEAANGHNRRNSQFTRSTSSSGLSDNSDRSRVRMSMPPVPFKSSPSILNTANSPRPDSLVKSALSNPPTTFEDIAATSDSGRSTPELRQARPDTADGFRPPSQERVPVQGFGSGGPNDRWRLKGKARTVIVVGSLYLQAGRWPDALRELVDGASMARSVNDHIWHGKALELITIALFLLAWGGVEFQVPTVCLPPQDKPPADGGMKDVESLDRNQPQHLRNLQVILPDLLDRIIGLYTKVASENLPPLPLSEAILRFCKILSALHIADGTLGEDSLRMMVLGDGPDKPLSTSARVTVKPSRQQIVALVFRAFPSSGSELLTTTDRISILSGIAAILGPLGQNRKKGMVMRELVSVLITGLVEARTRGAAEVGIHPAAGLVALTAAAEGQRKPNGSVALELQEGDVEQGIEAFLGVLCKTYGIVDFNPGQPSFGARTGDADDSGGAAVARIRRQSAARLFGFPEIKVNVLRACINFSEALPDFNGVMKFSSDLMRTAGSGVAPGPRREDASPGIARDEQARLASNITKTFGLSRKLGLDHVTAEYWDELLVRGIALEPLPITRVPIAHAKSVIPGVTTSRTSQDVDPFIYNPFLKKPDVAAVRQTLVVGEMATFRITLQNPYDIDLDIESIKVHGEGIDFEPSTESTVIGPYRTQVLKVSGVARSAGTLKVTGAVVRVRGCRERRFSVFSQPWAPQRDYKVKSTGLGALQRSLDLSGPAPPSLKTSELSLKVIPEQPTVVVKATSLPQSCVMILEGERQVFSVTLHNTSKTTPVDFMLFSFEDSTQGPLQAALTNRDSTPTELYEYELILMKKQALKLRKKNKDGRYIAPGGTATFEFEVLGKAGLTSAAIQIDYAHLGVPLEEVVDEFHTRRVSVQLTVTVNASVEISRHDVIPLHGELPQALWNRVKKTDAETSAPADQYCLLSLDLVNVWPSTMLFHIKGEDNVDIEEYILPGNTTRVVVPVRRIFIEDPHASIPALNPKRNRQFVVSSSKTTPDFERGVREAFWYREKMLDTLRATWKTLTGPEREGAVELRAIRLSTRMVDAIKVEEVGISVSVSGSEEGGDEAGTMYVDDFAKVRVRVENRTGRLIYPLVRLMPALCHRPGNVALDHARKFAWNGTLQQVLPLLGARSSAEVVMGVTALCRGQFEITASVEETMVWRDAEEEEEVEKRESGGRKRADTQSMVDAVIGKRERRMWHARKACVVMVRDRE
ncbi:related to hypercellular protein (hypA) [Cephalotrichum gorgonifer]|uniref:Related to hypercellular protein (HypA) n=1 Tax=Cephalotrichum gorgonifer TaxID=2041049 RepID=A0AAE8STN8_9PEZI|nr:related to hypercellular protein (hypA) [Cephalotrichum gorgonifer]